jgi:hypothetical protein
MLVYATNMKFNQYMLGDSGYEARGHTDIASH